MVFELKSAMCASMVMVSVEVSRLRCRIDLGRMMSLISVVGMLGIVVWVGVGVDVVLFWVSRGRVRLRVMRMCMGVLGRMFLF